MLTLVVLTGVRAFGQNVQHLSITVPGGMPGTPLVTGTNQLTNGVKVTWDGPPGYYQLFESSSTNNPHWVALTRKNDLLREATVPARYSNAVFKVSGPSPKYGGAESCVECHAPILNTYIHTAHAGAFTNDQFAAVGGQTNTSCLACHTVGFNLPTGYSTEDKTPQLAGVQCENCHGPAGPHEANPDNPAVRPRIEIAAQMCGGCHNDAASPTNGTFAEWSSSGHGLATNFYASTKSQVTDCGRCHSGSVRLSLLENTGLPTGDANLGVVCVVCHDPHQTNGNPVQLRNPIASTNDYFMPTNGTFAKFYNPQINLCAQCHNHAGANWTNTAEEPHHSLQYNMYLGTIGELASGLPPNSPGSHALLITNQCVACHMQSSPFESSSQPGVTGHSFSVTTYGLCVNCHFSTNTPTAQTLMANLVQSATNSTVTQIQAVKLALDFWATNNAPAALREKYGVLAWEFTKPGCLSSGGPGPNPNEQNEIPINIRKARFNLYIVQNEGSYGVHNPEYTQTLLNTAYNWVLQEVNP